MELVLVKDKFQVVIPQSIRKLADISVGDLLEASVEGGKITFTPKAVVDRSAIENASTTKRRGNSPPRQKSERRISKIN